MPKRLQYKDKQKAQATAISTVFSPLNYSLNHWPTDLESNVLEIRPTSLIVYRSFYLPHHCCQTEVAWFVSSFSWHFRDLFLPRHLTYPLSSFYCHRKGKRREWTPMISHVCMKASRAFGRAHSSWKEIKHLLKTRASHTQNCTPTAQPGIGARAFPGLSSFPRSSSPKQGGFL